MASYDALRHVTLGHYYPGTSPLHRLDPRAKLIAAGVGTVAIVVAASTAACLALALGVLALAALARLPLRHVWRILKPALPVFIVLALFQFLFAGGSGDDTLAYVVKAPWGPVRVQVGGLLTALSSIVRLVDLVLLVGLLMSTTSASGLTHGIEMLLRPLDRIGLPGHELAMVAAIALRFMPILGQELESILYAQASRGAGLDGRSRWKIAANARELGRVVVALFADAFRRVDEMTLAMLARCYQGGRGRTHLIERHFRPGDWLALALSVAALVGVILW